jgi:hypothetical protein
LTGPPFHVKKHFEASRFLATEAEKLSIPAVKSFLPKPFCPLLAFCVALRALLDCGAHQRKFNKEGDDAMKSATQALAALALLMGGLGHAKADIVLDFNSLPSAQGWTYYTNAGFPEGATFSANGTTLHQDTIQYDSIGGGVAYYKLPTAINPSETFEMDVTARVTATTNFPSPGPLDFGFFFELVTNGTNASIGLSATAIQSVDQLFASDIPFDNTTYHNYRFTGTPAGSFELFVDGNAILTGSALFDGEVGSFLAFGSGTNRQHAQADVTSFTFGQEPTNATPEPGSLILLGLGTAGLGVFSWRRRTGRGINRG